MATESEEAAALERLTHLAKNATGFEYYVLLVLLDPTYYLFWFGVCMTPLLIAAFWAATVLLKEDRKAAKRRMKRKKQRRSDREDKKTS